MESGKNSMLYKIKKISGDASFREFYKIEKNFNNSNSKERNISDYISGMTDKYAIDLYSSIK